MSSDNGMAKPLDSLSDEELFQQWLAVMDDTLEVFTTMLPSEVSRRLDYTPEFARCAGTVDPGALPGI